MAFQRLKFSTWLDMEDILWDRTQAGSGYILEILVLIFIASCCKRFNIKRVGFTFNDMCYINKTAFPWCCTLI